MENNEIIERIQQIEKYSLLACKRVLQIDDVALLTGLSRSYIYKLTSLRAIPFYKKSKTLYFDKEEIEKWLLSNRVSTREEAEQNAIKYCIKTK